MGTTLETHPLLGNGAINGDATVKHITPRKVTNGSTAGNGSSVRPASITSSPNNKGTVGCGVFRWIRPDDLTAVVAGVTNDRA
jgi:hypothetical protein